MNLSLSTTLKALIAASLFGLFVAAGSASVSASRGGGLEICPEGWRPVTPPLNPVLLCLPDTIVIDNGGQSAPPTGECPEGWDRVTPPLNPVLGCLPSNIAPVELPQKSAKGRVRDGICPEGWRPATQPLNWVLGCLPDNLYIPPTDPFGASPIPPGDCPEGWVPATQPLNPMLVCLPDTITYNPPRPSRGR